MTDELRAAAERWMTYHDERPQSAHAQEHAQAKLLAQNYLAEHPADDGEPAWRDRPPVAGKYLKYRRGGNSIFSEATVVALPEHAADVELYRWYGPIPADGGR